MHVSPHENQAPQQEVEPLPQIERSGNQSIRVRYVLKNSASRILGEFVYISSDGIVAVFHSSPFH